MSLDFELDDTGVEQQQRPNHLVDVAVMAVVVLVVVVCLALLFLPWIA